MEKTMYFFAAAPSSAPDTGQSPGPDDAKRGEQAGWGRR
jgi:hypothetical protein